jgi:hypothetical protein
VFDGEFAGEFVGSFCEFAFETIISIAFEARSSKRGQPNHVEELTLLRLNASDAQANPSKLIDHEDISDGRNGIRR